MALDPNRWTIKTQEAFNAATELARRRSNPEVTPDHLLAALLRQDEGVVLPVLTKVGRQPLSLRNAADEAVAKLPQAYGSEVRLARALQHDLRRRRRASAPSSATSTSPPSTSSSPWPSKLAVGRGGAARRPARGARQPPRHQPEPRGQLPGPREVRPRPHRGGPHRASSIPSSAATRRSAASSRSCRAARRTTPSSSASPASARPPSSRASPSASSPATCPRA